ncbi:unnamed protein product [Orchesella dallaii]|uniref:Odorant receptor n=1 Tax=Orchesella dallaii TaxID=48710 RepID=A0ABP1RZU4_9HEXA
MHSSRYLRILAVQIKCANFLGGTPFSWDSKRGKVFVKPSSLMKHFSIMFIFTLYTIYAISQVVYHLMIGKATDFKFFFLYAITVCAVIDIICAYPVARRPYHFAAVLNNFLRLLETFHHDYMPNYDVDDCVLNKVFDGVLILISLGSPFAAVIISSHYIFYSDWPAYPTSLLPEDFHSLPVKIAFGVIWYALLQFIWAILLTNMVYLFTFGMYNWQILHEFMCRAGGVRGQKTIREFREFSVIRVNYRKFELVYMNIHELICALIIPLESVILNLALFCNFTLITYSNLLTPINACILLIWNGMGTFGVLIGLTYAGEVYNKGVKTLGSMGKYEWGSKLNNKIMKKFVKSCRPIQIGYGRMYVIRKLSVFKFMRSLTKGTVRVLLMLKKYT